MLSLAEFRQVYPEYDDMTDYELGRALHQERGQDMDYEQFARAVGAPARESKLDLAVREWNRKHPDEPISAEGMDESVITANEYNSRHPDSQIKPWEIGEGGFLGDMGHAVMAGVDEIGALPFWGAEQLLRGMGFTGAASGAARVKDWYKNKAQAWRDSSSADMKLAREKEFIPYDREKGYSLGDAWSDPRAIMSTVAESLPGMAAGMGAGGAVAKALIGRGMSAGLAWGIGSAVGEGGVAGGQNSMDVYDQVMKTPEETLAQSPEYQELLRQYAPAEARQRLADSAAALTGIQTGVSTGALGAPAGAMFGRMLGGETGRTMARSMGKMAATEALEETLQSGAEEYLSQRQARRADPSIEPLAGVPNAMAAGALAGAVMGGGMGPLGHWRGKNARPGEAGETMADEEFAPAPGGEAAAGSAAPQNAGTTPENGAGLAGHAPEIVDYYRSQGFEGQDLLDMLEADRVYRQSLAGSEASAASVQTGMNSGGQVDLLEAAGPVQDSLAESGRPAVNAGQSGQAGQTNQADPAGAPAGLPEIAPETAPRPQAEVKPYVFPDITQAAGDGTALAGMPNIGAPDAAPEVRPYVFPVISQTGGAALAGMPDINNVGPEVRPYVFPDITRTIRPASPIPGQSRITNTQAQPRADTVRQAEILGMPAPEALPQEAREVAPNPPVQAAPQPPVFPESPAAGMPPLAAMEEAQDPVAPQESGSTDMAGETGATPEAKEPENPQDFLKSHVIIGSAPFLGGAPAETAKARGQDKTERNNK